MAPRLLSIANMKAIVAVLVLLQLALPISGLADSICDENSPVKKLFTNVTADDGQLYCVYKSDFERFNTAFSTDAIEFNFGEGQVGPGKFTLVGLQKISGSICRFVFLTAAHVVTSISGHKFKGLTFSPTPYDLTYYKRKGRPAEIKDFKVRFHPQTKLNGDDFKKLENDFALVSIATECPLPQTRVVEIGEEVDFLKSVYIQVEKPDGRLSGGFYGNWTGFAESINAGIGLNALPIPAEPGELTGISGASILQKDSSGTPKVVGVLFGANLKEWKFRFSSNREILEWIKTEAGKMAAGLGDDTHVTDGDAIQFPDHLIVDPKFRKVYQSD